MISYEEASKIIKDMGLSPVWECRPHPNQDWSSVPMAERRAIAAKSLFKYLSKPVPARSPQLTPIEKAGRTYLRENRKLADGLRRRIHHALKGHRKAYPLTLVLGCTVEHLRSHLEKNFYSGMTWDNYGDWHVDHIRPCASFDLADPEQQKVCFHYTNLQPPLGDRQSKEKRESNHG